MQEENLWEEYGDMSFHEDLFKITSLLYKAYNGKFPHPDAADVIIQISALNHDAETFLPKVDEVLISRLISKGMSEHAVINRLFHDFVDAGEWKEAKDIIWQFNASELTQKSVQIEFTTGVYWVKELRGAENYTVEFNFH